MTVFNYTVVDAFTTAPFSGNPAAVIILSASDKLLDLSAHKIAAEFNISETAYVVPRAVPGDVEDNETRTFGLRWFTPIAGEIVLCGHATLASAKVLFSQPKLVPEHITTLRFETLSGILTAKKVSKEGQIELEFPEAALATVGHDVSVRVTAAVSEALGATVAIRDTRKGGIFIMVHIDESFDLEKAIVNPTPFLQLKDQCLAVTLTSQRPYAPAPNAKFISRTFGPATGSPEDPVCGSVHCLLAPYWSQLLAIPPGEIVTTRQVSPRGGDLEVIWEKSKSTVKIRGHAVIVARGEMYA
ncbi:hypothetical protein FRB96_003641 [Tulasnella sp. 330]|nr:hypothetical protein FRB96_003641 [Tulasnella sp. 330]KAG8876408.1 hypothetical protein FRB97_004182 [Tulasnella sp. 331]